MAARSELARGSLYGPEQRQSSAALARAHSLSVRGELLVKQKRMTKTQPVPCVIRTEGLAEEDSLAENVHRADLHPLDQFRAFQTLRAKGLSEEEIAARFFVNPTVVKQRLKLAAVSEKLLDVYAEEGMTLEQLMAFTVTNDHARQEQVRRPNLFGRPLARRYPIIPRHSGIAARELGDVSCDPPGPVARA